MLVLIVALFFVFPWLPEPSPAGAALERYSPEHDGGSLLIENYDADGRLVSTESQNLALIPDLRAFTESRRAINDELDKIYGAPENMEDAQVVEVRRRTLEESGAVSNATDTLILDSRGLLLLGSREGEAGTDLVFDRPAILLYLGYILFSIAVLNWAVATHDISQVDFFTGQAALGGFGLLGKPLIYAIFAVTLAESAVQGEGEPDPQQAAS